MIQEDSKQGFVVKQQTFEGPLDLLLQLIEEEELDVTTIALAKVTDAYLTRLKDLERQNLPEISDFLVIAARLILLKSRALLPEESVEEDEPDDLAERLAEYKAYKDLSKQIGGELASARLSLGKPPLVLEPPSEFVTDGVDIACLHRAFTEILDQLSDERPGRTETLDEKITIDECIARVKADIGGGSKSFGDLFASLKSRVAVIVTFLAILELVKQRLLSVRPEAGTLMVGMRA